MKKALFVANVDRFHKGFHIPHIERLKENGFIVELASNGNVSFEGVGEKHQVSFGRKPMNTDNIHAFFQMRKLFSNYYDLIYFSTPVVGVVGRLALIGKKRGRVVYSSHGFSFYSGNSGFRNFIYRTIEKVLCKLTDCLITMNQEDYSAVQKYRFPCKEVYKVNGVGINTSKFNKLSFEEKRIRRKEMGVPEDAFILIYPAELSKRKNQYLLFSIMDKLKEKNVILLLPGAGSLDAEYKEMVRQKGLEKQVLFLGYRDDVNILLGMSDVLVASSLHEGLPINVIEAMASGLPIVATNVRGQLDLVQEGENGFLFEPNDCLKAVSNICTLMADKDVYERMSEAALSASTRYEVTNVVKEYDTIWKI